MKSRNPKKENFSLKIKTLKNVSTGTPHVSGVKEIIRRYNYLSG
jgi:hypothetical protein